MQNNKIYLITFTMLAALIGLLISQWEVLQSLSNEMGWVLKELPEVKYMEYLGIMKKG